MNEGKKVKESKVGKEIERKGREKEIRKLGKKYREKNKQLWVREKVMLENIRRKRKKGKKNEKDRCKD